MIWKHTSWLSKSHKLNDYHDKPWLQEEQQRLKQTPKQMKTTVEAVIHKSFTSLTGTSIQEVKEKKLAWSRGGPTPILSGQLWCWISTRWLCGKHWLFSINAQHQHQFLMYTDILWGGKDTTRRNQGEQCHFIFTQPAHGELGDGDVPCDTLRRNKWRGMTPLMFLPLVSCQRYMCNL